MIIPSANVLDLTLACAAHWQPSGAARGAWVSIHKVALVPREVLAQPLLVPLADLACLLFWGKIRYHQNVASPIEFGDGSTPILLSATLDEAETEPNSWAIVCAPFRADGGLQEEPELRARGETAFGILSATLGENVAFERLTECSVDLTSNTISSTSPSWKMPFVRPAPDLSNIAIESAINIAKTVASSEPHVRDRLSLALRWYRQALQADGVDGLLKGWIAIEILAMPGTDIAPLCDLLGRGYSVSASAAKAELMIGQLFGLRSHIVHYGRPLSVDYRVVCLIAAVFVDALLALLGERPRHEARLLLSSNEVDLRSLVNSTLKSASS